MLSKVQSVTYSPNVWSGRAQTKTSLLTSGGGSGGNGSSVHEEASQEQHKNMRDLSEEEDDMALIDWRQEIKNALPDEVDGSHHLSYSLNQMENNRVT